MRHHQRNSHPDASTGVLHIPALDGLRGLAALVVALSHLSALTGIAAGFFGTAGGQLGVILFFALSGFLMAYMYFGTPLSLRNLWHFAVARIARVVPLFLLIVFASYIIAESCGDGPGCPWAYPMSTQALIDHLLLRKGEGVMWTIPLELKFYALFPIFWLLLRMSSSVGALAIAGLLLLYFWLPPGEMPVMRLGHYFLLGLLVCLLVRLSERMSTDGGLALPRLGAVALLLGILLVVSSFPGIFWTLFGRAPKIWWEPTVALAMALLLFGAVCGGLAQRFFEGRVLSFLGEVSYAFYLTHMIVFQNLRKAVDPGQHPWLFTVFSLPLAVAVATAIYYLFERPVRHRLRAALSRPWDLTRSAGGEARPDSLR